MGFEFRQRSAGEYVEMLRRRKWFVILPTIVFFIATVWVVSNLPNMYISRSSLIIMPPTISEKVAPSLTDADLSQRVQAMKQVVLSRSSLEPMILKYDLYAEERASGVPIERVIGRMIGDVGVITETADDRKVVGFTISYRNRSPEAAQDVTAGIAQMYVAASNLESTQSAETTRQFINDRLAQAKSVLDGLEQERLNVMRANVQTLPESSHGLIAQLEGLRQREQTISKDKETLIIERGRVQESIRAMNSQMRLIEDYGERETNDAVARASRVEDTPAYGQLIQKRAEVTARLENLKTQYRDKHPEIVQAEGDIRTINDEINKLAQTTKQRAEQATQLGTRKAQMQRESLGIEKARAESQIGMINQQMANKENDLRQNAGQITLLEAKINTIPNVKVALEGVEGQYQSAKSNYDELLKKFNDAQQQVVLETNAQGETIQVVDPASLPQEPANAAKRPFLMFAGTMGGLVFGLMLAAGYESRRFLTIQNIEDARYYTGLPVLASIPPLRMEQDIQQERRAYNLRLAAGVVGSVLLIPVLVVVMQITGIFERFG
ncbi:MAG: hypothetical protein H0V76_01945 [Blastocatellia bacterium]|nr:hypothetical protein [Blastocatellia bacterium]